MVDEPIELNMKLWDYEDVKEKLMDLLARLTDPKFIQEDPDNPIDPPKLFGNVESGHPDNLELFNGTLAKVVLNNKNDADEVGQERAEIKGMIICYVPGKDSEAADYCVYISDIVESLLENLKDGKVLKSLGIYRCTIIPNPTNTQNWIPINIDPQGKQPQWCIISVTGFIVTKTKAAPIAMTI